MVCLGHHKRYLKEVNKNACSDKSIKPQVKVETSPSDCIIKSVCIVSEVQSIVDRQECYQVNEDTLKESVPTQCRFPSQYPHTSMHPLDCTCSQKRALLLAVWLAWQRFQCGDHH